MKAARNYPIITRLASLDPTPRIDIIHRVGNSRRRVSQWRRSRNDEDSHFELLFAIFSAWLRNRSECRSRRALAGLLRRVRANRWYLSASAVFTSTMFLVTDFLVMQVFLYLIYTYVFHAKALRRRVRNKTTTTRRAQREYIARSNSNLNPSCSLCRCGLLIFLCALAPLRESQSIKSANRFSIVSSPTRMQSISPIMLNN
jgi:hypothetical protein